MSRTNLLPKPVTEYDLRLLRIYKAVVENGGFSAAEAELGITRSTISVHMGSLESRMKLKLCVRGRGGFTLTEAGQTVYHACSELFESLNDFSLLVRSLNSELSGELVILCADQLDLAKQKRLANVIRQIHQHAPKLNLVLDGDSIQNIEKSLLKDKAHVGLFPNYKQVDGLEYSGVFSEPMYLCCAKEHPLFEIEDKQIDEQRLATYSAIHPGLDVDQAGRTQLHKLKLEARAYQFDTRKALILSGVYIGYLPLSHVEQEVAQGEIRLICAQSCHYDFTLSMANKKTPREQAKIALIKDAFTHF
ncbi:LysR family transcriptional regulator [Aliiglaciecola sp. LCG003]|uniref:LysR family transcriptional regulator n=1 Tax=Aliiglaciecola sp. LCG003 TaxID=3053655 RepID=UPI0025736C8E|nr:LysR family transcriptional regulator [Aliiglaciecola sp. LCG003]WJG10097.1 LysR family transcriptional regulator [Aliiglaciecola sp. LCG003]